MAVTLQQFFSNCTSGVSYVAFVLSLFEPAHDKTNKIARWTVCYLDIYHMYIKKQDGPICYLDTF